MSLERDGGMEPKIMTLGRSLGSSPRLVYPGNPTGYVPLKFKLLASRMLASLSHFLLNAAHNDHARDPVCVRAPSLEQICQ